jgi:hypothetical protein
MAASPVLTPFKEGLFKGKVSVIVSSSFAATGGGTFGFCDDAR